MSDISDELFAELATQQRFITLAHLGVAIGDLNHWDEILPREPRLLVPVDVSALVVRAGGQLEPMVRLPFRAAGEPEPDPGAAGTPRDPGVHLMWSVPSAFGRGKLIPDPAAPADQSRRLLQLPPLPDRWVVLRLAVGARDPLVRGWVIEADAATISPLADWPTVRSAIQNVGLPVPPERLDLHVGGASWATSYDAALGRLALHDPLDDLAQVAPQGVAGDALSYVVAGWWTAPERDPLDGAGSIFGYQDRLAELGWDDPDHPAPDRPEYVRQRKSARVAETFRMKRGSRFETSATADDYRPAVSKFAREGRRVSVVPQAPTRQTLLHGRIHGVPYTGPTAPDDRPAPGAVRCAFGPTSPSVGALLASGAVMSPATPDQQRDAERLLTAFSTGLLTRIDDPNVWPEIDYYEHAQGFLSTRGEVVAVDRFRDQPRAGNDPGSGSRVGRRGKVQFEPLDFGSTILYSATKSGLIGAAAYGKKAPGAGNGLPQASTDAGTAAAQAAAAGTIRTAERPAPPFNTPVSPVLAVLGAGRRVLAAERDEADGLLRVRTSDQPDRGVAGVLAADELLHTIGSGAVPDEVLALARESLAGDPYLAAWRTERARRGDDDRVVDLRLRAEAVLNYAYYSGDDTTLAKVVGTAVGSPATRQMAVEGLLRHSLHDGVWAHPDGVTMWGQPWRPQFCEWTAELDLADLAELLRSDGWALGEFDLERGTPLGTTTAVTLTGRSPLVTSVAGGLAAAVAKWLADERTRDAAGHGLASPEVEQAMAGLQVHLSGLDLLSVTLDGVRERLLGLAYDRGVVHADADLAADGTRRALAVAVPELVAAGRIRLVAARLVDSFGRILDLPVDSATVVARAREAGQAGATLAVPPRITAASRVHLRLVDPLATGTEAATAVVDQVDPNLQVNPVAGFLLPDHIDEALEMFATDGTPLGQLSHDAFGDAVFWEGAPGRTDIGPAAGPLDDPDPGRRRLGWIAAGLVAADAADRQVSSTRSESESPLSALLRAIDTTLWTVDPFGALGREHIAGLVARPIAVVTARLTLDVAGDLDELVYGTTTTRAERAAAFAELATIPFGVHLGTTLRNDDGLVGYFVDDDYGRFHVIDREIADQARESGRGRGELGPTGTSSVVPITHPYVGRAGVVPIRAGQTVRLTLLVHPGGKVHVTSGIAPRTSVALARDWVHPGLSVMAPSVRVGPLLIDPDKVRLPKVSAFPADQLFTRRDTPGSWRDDPIVSASQHAFLPDQASTVQEGWVRINPNPAGVGT